MLILIIIYISLGVIGVGIILREIIQNEGDDYEKFNVLEIIMFTLTAIVFGWSILIFWIFTRDDKASDLLEKWESKWESSKNWFIKFITKKIFF